MCIQLGLVTEQCLCYQIGRSGLVCRESLCSGVGVMWSVHLNVRVLRDGEQKQPRRWGLGATVGALSAFGFLHCEIALHKCLERRSLSGSWARGNKRPAVQTGCFLNLKKNKPQHDPRSTRTPEKTLNVGCGSHQLLWFSPRESGFEMYACVITCVGSKFSLVLLC